MVRFRPQGRSFKLNGERDAMPSFIPDWPTLAAFIAASVVLTITPGPDMTLFLSRTLSQGRAAGFACMFGAFAGIAVHTTMVALGLSALIVAAPAAFTALKIIGAGYLVWLAVDAVRNGSSLTMKTENRQPPKIAASFLTGLGINLLNPKIILFFMTFLPQFVAAGDLSATGKFFFLGAFFVVIAVPITSAMILAASWMSQTLKRKPIVTRLIDWLMASVFSAFAVRILFAQARQ
jgi:threonine/homoserine/homoserine lactone efflux protein